MKSLLAVLLTLLALHTLAEPALPVDAVFESLAANPTIPGKGRVPDTL